MGKQAKKKVKTEAQVKGQKHHNKATRGINTRRRGAVYDTRQRKFKDKEGNERIVTEDVIVPPGTGWDMFDRQKNDPSAAQPPFDALHLDWREELMHYVADNEGTHIGREPQGDGTFLYQVYEESPGGNRKVLFEIVSAQKFILERSRKRGAKKVV